MSARSTTLCRVNGDGTAGKPVSSLLHRQAVEAVHEPADLDVAEAARVRLAFDELLFMQLTLLVRRALSRCAPQGELLAPPARRTAVG